MKKRGRAASANETVAVAPRSAAAVKRFFAEHQRLLEREGQTELARGRYAALYDSAPVGYAILDLHGCIRDLNLTGAALLSRRREHLIGGPLVSLVTKQDRRKFLRHLHLLRRQAGSASVDVHVGSPGGATRLLQLLSDSTAWLHGDAGDIRTVFTDVTAQRRLELELSQSQAELASIVQSSADSLVSIGPDQRIVHFNPAAEAMFGCASADAVDRPIGQFIPVRLNPALEGRNGVFGLWANSLANPSGPLDLWGLRPDGRTFPIEATISRVAVEGKGLVTLTMRDATSRKDVERIKSEARDELEMRVGQRTAELFRVNAALVAEVTERRSLQRQLLEISEREQRRIGQDLHDGVGQQLTGMMLLTDTLAGRLKELSLPEQAQAQRLAALLDQVRRQVRQISRGLHPVALEARGLATALSDLAETSASVYGIKCTLRLPQRVGIADNVVATHLFRIAQEAVHNAVRHGHSRRVTLSLRAQNGSVLLSIRDNGRGLDSTLSAVPPGLGLRIMRSRSEAIGGSLTIGPVRPHGTMVECIVPKLTYTNAKLAS